MTDWHVNWVFFYSLQNEIYPNECWLVGLYSISTFVSYLMPDPFYTNSQFYFKQFSLAWVHDLIIKHLYFKQFILFKQF